MKTPTTKPTPLHSPTRSSSPAIASLPQCPKLTQKQPHILCLLCFVILFSSFSGEVAAFQIHQPLATTKSSMSMHDKKNSNTLSLCSWALLASPSPYSSPSTNTVTKTATISSTSVQNTNTNKIKDCVFTFGPNSLADAQGIDRVAKLIQQVRRHWQNTPRDAAVSYNKPSTQLTLSIQHTYLTANSTGIPT
jgi:hypothetical protein